MQPIKPDYYIDPISGCWLWLKHLDRAGYGKCDRDGQTLAHRAYWIKFRGPIPRGKKVLHRCDVRRCVNPDHLFLGTQKDNVHDMLQKNRRHSSAGEKNPKAKLTQLQIDHIRSGEQPAAYIAAELGMHVSTIYRILRGDSWHAQANR